MPPPESRKYLWDAIHAAELVLQFIGIRTFEEYQRDIILQSAVERQLIIIGEALGQMARHDPETALRFPDLPQVVAFRNVLVHGYDVVDPERVWAIVKGPLEGPGATLQLLLDEA